MAPALVRHAAARVAVHRWRLAMDATSAIRTVVSNGAHRAGVSGKKARRKFGLPGRHLPWHTLALQLPFRPAGGLVFMDFFSGCAAHPDLSEVPGGA